MSRPNNEDDQYVRNRRVLKRVLLQCEETGKFTLSSRKFFEVGELGLAANGLYRFIHGNPEFKKVISQADMEVVLVLTEEPAKLKPFHWA